MGASEKVAVALNPYVEIYSNTLYAKANHVGGGLIIIYQLDSYERWIVHVRYVRGGLNFEDLFYEVVGKATEGWIDNHFEDDDSEDLRCLSFGGG
jgi:hypothetical protein